MCSSHNTYYKVLNQLYNDLHDFSKFLLMPYTKNHIYPTEPMDCI